MTVLTMAPNVVAPWITVQDQLFRRFGIVSSRLFPPCIPLAWQESEHSHDANALMEYLRHYVAAMDRIRKTCPLKLFGFAGDMDARDYLPASVGLDLAGFRELRRAVADQSPPTSIQEAFTTTPRLVAAWERHQDLTGAQRRELAEVMADPPPLPATRAFWLTVFELFPGPDPRMWWNGASWQELFRRRTTVVDHGRDDPDASRSQIM